MITVTESTCSVPIKKKKNNDLSLWQSKWNKMHCLRILIKGRQNSWWIKNRYKQVLLFPCSCFLTLKKKKWYQISPIFPPAHFILYSHHPSISIYPISCFYPLSPRLYGTTGELGIGIRKQRLSCEYILWIWVNCFSSDWVQQFEGQTGIMD